MWFPRWVAVFGVILALILLVGGAVAAATTAPGTSSTSVPARLAMPTYAGPDGVRVPLGSCAVVQGGKVLIVACDSPPAKVYKASVAAATRRRAQQQALWGWGGAALGLLIGLAIVIGARMRWRRQRAVDAGAAPGSEAPHGPLPAESGAEHDTSSGLGA